MVKFDNKTLALRKDNFRVKIRSKRLSQRRLNIQRSLNSFKRNFKKKRLSMFEPLFNKDSNDIISMEPVKNISKYDLFVFDNGSLRTGTSASNMMKWLARSGGEEIPKNPFTNLPMKKENRHKCYRVAKRFLNKNKKTFPDSGDYQELENVLDTFEGYEYMRSNPHVNIMLRMAEIDRLLLEVRELAGNNNNVVCMCYRCLQLFDQFPPFNMPIPTALRLRDIGYRLEFLYDKIDDIESKISQNYFV